MEWTAMTKCKICDALKVRVGGEPWNEPLIETRNFVVIPSLGALVEGWVLVVPKEHCISLGALRAEFRGEAQEVEERTRAVLRQRYEKPIVAFEHGPSAENHGTGCGVDHAHLHLVPLACDLLSFVEPFVPASLEWKACNWEDLEQAHVHGLDYLYLRPDGKTALMAVCEDFGSQVFRKAVASFLCMESEFSWREFPQMERVAQTIGTLSDALVRQTGGEPEHAA